MRRALTTLALVGGLTALAGTAHAQVPWDAPSPRGFVEVPRSGGHVELGFWQASRDELRLASFSILGRLGLVLERTTELRFTYGIAYGDLDAEVFGQSEAWTSGNPMLSVLYVAGEETFRLRVGGGVAVPLVADRDGDRNAAYFAAASRGLSEIWLWTSERVGLVPELSLEWVPTEPLYFEGSVRPGVLVAIDDDVGLIPPEDNEDADAIDPVDVVVEAAIAAGLRADNFFGGVRLRAIFSPTLATETFQTSVEGFFRVTGMIADSVELFGEARLNVALDPNLGFGFAELGHWGAFLSIGAAATPAEIEDGRYGVENLTIHGAEQMDAEAVAACLGTRDRSTFNVDIGLRGAPSCGEPPFDGSHLIVDFWHWPWTEWPLYDESVFERDLERIERWYRARGYLDARVVDTEVDPPAATGTDRHVEGCGAGDESDCTVDVSVTVEEGEPVRIARMSIRGIDVLPEGMREQLRVQLRFSRDDRFDEALYELTKRDMLRVLADAGYAHARVEGAVKLNRGRREAYIVFIVDADLPNVVGRVCVTGYDNLPPDTLLAVADLAPGETFSLAALEESQRALYALGAFSSVEIRPEDREENEEVEGAGDDASSEPPVVDAEDVDVQIGDTDRFCQDGPAQVEEGHEPVDIEIRVAPGRAFRYGFGGGFQAGQAITFGTATNFAGQQDAAQWDIHLSATLEHRNLFDRLIRWRFELRPRLIFEMPVFNFTPAQNPPFGIQAVTSFRWPAFLEPRTNLLFQLREDLGPMPFTGFFRSELDGVLGPERTWLDGRLYTAAFIHGNWFFPTDVQPIDPTQRLPETGSLWLEEVVRLDLRDDPRNPRAGAYFAITSQQSVQPLSSWDMIAVNAEARGYIPLPFGIVLAGRFEIGVMHIESYDQSLLADNVYQLNVLGPTLLHLRGGGASSNRGYLPGLLGDAVQRYVNTPRSRADLERGLDIQQRPVRISGGTRSWEASLELRVPITAAFGVVLFGDAGDVSRPPLGSTSSDAPFRFDHPQVSVGLGIRYRTIVGPLRLDLAWAPPELRSFGGDSSLPPTCTADSANECNPRNYLFTREFPAAVHITIGEAF